MLLSISNIGWQTEEDAAVYELMKRYGYSGLEIAPTRIFSEKPYDKRKEASVWAEKMKREHNFVVPSMQSIWFGRNEKLFGDTEERKILLDYTKKAIDFAQVIGCKNLVFGCPQNRVLPDGADPELAVSFFREIGNYAAAHGTVIGMEANPPIYHTNYINDTLSALNLVEQVGSKGFLLNLDVGTMIYNRENINEFQEKVCFINHVHISEPELKPIAKRTFHEQLYEILAAECYKGYVSIEMKRTDSLCNIEKALQYVKEIFGDE